MSGRVLVTGCAGYLGSTLCSHLLRAGWMVVGVDDFLHKNQVAISHLLGERRFVFWRHDARDVSRMRGLLARVDAVVPLAALVGAPLCEARPALAKEVNFQAVRDLVKELSPRQRLVYPNTNSGYGYTPGDREVTEDDPLDPVSLYGRTKADAEKCVLDHPQGVSLRLATVFGTSARMRFDLLVNDFVQKLITEKDLRVFDPHFRRSVVGVQDVARAFLHAMEKDGPPLRGAYNVALPGANLTKAELAEFVARQLLLDPASCVRTGEGSDPDNRNYAVSSRRLLDTGFRFTHTLERGVYEVGQLARLLRADEVLLMRNA